MLVRHSNKLRQHICVLLLGPEGEDIQILSDHLNARPHLPEYIRLVFCAQVGRCDQGHLHGLHVSAFSHRIHSERSGHVCHTFGCDQLTRALLHTQE